MNIEFEKKIGNNLRLIREQNGFTQEYVSTKLQLNGCDITRSALAKIEVGQRHIYLDELYHLKIILKTSFDEIFKIWFFKHNKKHPSFGCFLFFYDIYFMSQHLDILIYSNQRTVSKELQISNLKKVQLHKLDLLYSPLTSMLLASS